MSYQKHIVRDCVKKCYKSEYYKQNCEKIKQNQKRRRIDNPEHFRKLEREKYYRNKDSHIQRNRDYKQKNPEKVKIWKARSNAQPSTKESKKRYALNNKDKIRKSQLKYIKSNEGKITIYEWKCKNKEKILSSKAKYRNKNREIINFKQREWKKHNRGKVNYETALRRSNKKQRTPKWLNCEQKLKIKQIYENCPKGFHVDHIIPLAGENVCGLHVPWNLQYLTPKENLTKNNKLIIHPDGKQGDKTSVLPIKMDKKD